MTKEEDDWVEMEEEQDSDDTQEIPKELRKVTRSSVPVALPP